MSIFIYFDLFSLYIIDIYIYIYATNITWVWRVDDDVYDLLEMSRIKIVNNDKNRV